MNYQKDPHVEITVSNESYRSKPTSSEIALEVENLKHGWVRKTTHTTLTDLINYIETGRILYPTQCFEGSPIINPMNLFFMNEKVMMCIEFVYDKNNKNIRRGDHDNKEVKQVIDAISSFVVPDDSDNYLSLCQISTEGEYNHTKVYVMPERCFSAFFLDHSKNK